MRYTVIGQTSKISGFLTVAAVVEGHVAVHTQDPDYDSIATVPFVSWLDAEDPAEAIEMAGEEVADLLLLTDPHLALANGPDLTPGPVAYLRPPVKS